jgi:cytoskeletal protein CcmA (bactofilin family)
MSKMKWIIPILSIALFITPAYSLVIKSGDNIELKEWEVIEDDLIALGQTIDIKGTVTGDLYAFAQNVTISGKVDGTIFTGASSVDINAESVMSIWAAGGNIAISGNVSNNVILAGGNLAVQANANIGKDIRAYGGQLNVKGNVAGAIKGGVGKFSMEGKTSRIKISADDVKIKSSAVISGDVIVQSEKEPVIEEGAVISGETRCERPSQEEKTALFAFAPFIAFFITFMKIVIFIAKIIVGIIIIALFGGYVRRIMDTLIKSPWKSLGWGFLGLIVIPVAVVILFAILIGFPIAIFGIYIYSILFYLSSIFIGLVIGEKIIQLFKKEGKISLYLSFIIGILVLFVLGLIPILGLVIKIFVLLFGAGMLILGTWNLMKDMRAKKLI